jgi:hypothetical protein
LKRKVLVGFAEVFSQELDSAEHCSKNDSKKEKRKKERKTGENMN